MKTSPPLSLSVAPELCEAAEEVLREGETLSAFLETALRAHIEQRQVQDAFLARGLASGEKARRTGRYIAAETVLSELSKQLERAKKTSR